MLCCCCFAAPALRARCWCRWQEDDCYARHCARATALPRRCFADTDAAIALLLLMLMMPYAILLIARHYAMHADDTFMPLRYAAADMPCCCATMLSPLCLQHTRYCLLLSVRTYAILLPCHDVAADMLRHAARCAAAAAMLPLRHDICYGKMITPRHFSDAAAMLLTRHTPRRPAGWLLPALRDVFRHAYCRAGRDMAMRCDARHKRSRHVAVTILRAMPTPLIR